MLLDQSHRSVRRFRAALTLVILLAAVAIPAAGASTSPRACGSIHHRQGDTPTVLRVSVFSGSVSCATARRVAVYATTHDGTQSGPAAPDGWRCGRGGPTQETTVSGFGCERTDDLSSIIEAKYSKARCKAHVLRATAKVKRALRKAHLRGTGTSETKGPLGHVYYARCGNRSTGTYWAAAAFSHSPLGLTDQPERFSRKAHHGWVDRGDTGTSTAGFPKRVIRAWGLADGFPL